MNWVHGTYSVNDNGSLTMTPFGDGYQQIQNPCAAVSNFIENYNLTELYTMWQIFQDPTTGYKLHLFQFDGSPLAPQFQVSTTPNMLPLQSLRNVTPAVTTDSDGVTSESKRGLFKRSAAPRSLSIPGALAAATLIFGSALATLLL